MLSTLIGMHIVNGRIRPRFGKKATIRKIILMGVMLAGFLFLFYLGVKGESYYLALSLIGIASLIYIMIITPEFQNPNNYFIKLKDENSLEGFEIYYKDKQVKMDYKIDSEGKIAFIDNKHKTDSVSYLDGSPMSRLERFKIVNFFTQWLYNNNLLSKEVKTSFE